jgi:hypothetical protein
MVVLLVYGDNPEPATLILQGNEGQAWISVINTPAQHLDPRLRSRIEEAIQTAPLG